MAAVGTVITTSRSTETGGDIAAITGTDGIGTTGAGGRRSITGRFSGGTGRSAPLLSSWYAFDWATPYYWDYGPGEYINCYNDVVYVNGQWFEPAPVYYQRTIVLAESAPISLPEQAVQIEWLPLGVFAISRDGVVDNNLLVQLAVTKDGVIGGTVLNQATGSVVFDSKARSTSSRNGPCGRTRTRPASRSRWRPASST